MCPLQCAFFAQRTLLFIRFFEVHFKSQCNVQGTEGRTCTAIIYKGSCNQFISCISFHGDCRVCHIKAISVNAWDRDAVDRDVYLNSPFPYSLCVVTIVKPGEFPLDVLTDIQAAGAIWRQGFPTTRVATTKQA